MVAGRGARLAPLWSAVKTALEANPQSVGRGLGAGLHPDSSTLFASFALRDGMERLFKALLSGADSRVDSSMATAGLSASSSQIRTSSYLFLATHKAGSSLCQQCESMEPQTLVERIARHLYESSLDASRRERFVDLLAALANDPDAKAELKPQYGPWPRAFQELSLQERSRMLKALDLPDDHRSRNGRSVSPPLVRV